MAEKRKDSKGRILKDNEYQRSDGKYGNTGQGSTLIPFSWQLATSNIHRHVPQPLQGYED